MTWRCLIVDDNAAFLDASRELLRSQGIDVVGVARSGAECRSALRNASPEVILLDVDLGGESGFDLARELAARPGAIERDTILITAHDEEDYADLIDESPALGLIPKPDVSRRSIEALRAADRQARLSATRDT